MSASAVSATLCPACDTVLLSSVSCCSDSSASCGGACGSFHGCSILACPGCGRAWPHPGRSRLAFWLARWLARREPARRTAAPVTVQAPPAANPLSADTLAALAPGSTARIAELRCASPERLQQLTALGLVPGTEVRLHRRRPAFLVEIDQTTLALDAQVAQEIRLAPADG